MDGDSGAAEEIIEAKRLDFYTKIAKSGWCFCYQRQKQSRLGNLM
jgi:hypothetical protein